MLQYDNITKDILYLYAHHSSQYMIKSLLFRKQAKVIFDGNGSMILWGPSVIIGGEFSQSISIDLKTLLQDSESPCYIYSPDGEWKSYIENTFSGNIKEKEIKLYQANKISELDCQINTQYITPITKKWLESNLSNSQLIREQLYSYTTEEDFFQNGFGLALVIDDEVCGYCLSEYSIDNECAINIWVDEKYRGLGYAKTMTNLFLRHSKKSNWKVFWACELDNIPSNKVVLSSGFVLHSTQQYFKLEKF